MEIVESSERTDKEHQSSSYPLTSSPEASEFPCKPLCLGTKLLFWRISLVPFGCFWLIICLLRPNNAPVRFTRTFSKNLDPSSNGRRGCGNGLEMPAKVLYPQASRFGTVYFCWTKKNAPQAFHNDVVEEKVQTPVA